MSRDHAIPVERKYILDRVLIFDRRDVVRHVAVLQGLDRDEIHQKDQLLLRQPHDERTVGMVTADVDEFKRGTAERDHLLLVYNLVRHYDRVEERVLLFRPLEMRLG